MMVAYIHNKTPKDVTRVFKYTSYTQQLFFAFNVLMHNGMKNKEVMTKS